MKFVTNAGTHRVLDLVRPWLKPGYRMPMISPSFSLLAFAEVLADGGKMPHALLHGVRAANSNIFLACWLIEREIVLALQGAEVQPEIRHKTCDESRNLVCQGPRTTMGVAEEATFRWTSRPDQTAKRQAGRTARRLAAGGDRACRPAGSGRDFMTSRRPFSVAAAIQRRDGRSGVFNRRTRCLDECLDLRQCSAKRVFWPSDE